LAIAPLLEAARRIEGLPAPKVRLRFEFRDYDPFEVDPSDRLASGKKSLYFEWVW